MFKTLRFSALSAVLFLTACGSEEEPEPAVDADGDGVNEDKDCDDTNADIHPNADEVCDVDDVDENCNGLADDDDDATLTSSMWTFYPNADGDGFGDSQDPGLTQCEDPSTAELAYLQDASDCDHSRADVYPG